MEAQKKSIFRQESLRRLSSPEQLNDYLKVTRLGVWIVLAAVILLLAGLLAWGFTGSLESIAAGKAVVRDGMAEIVSEEPAKGDIAEGMIVRIDGEEYTVPAAEEGSGPAIRVPVELPDGEYEVKIVMEVISPISFLLN